MTYSYIIGDDYINLTNITNGNSVTVYDDQPKYDDFKSLIIAKEFSDAEALVDVKTVVSKFIGTIDGAGGFAVKLEDGNLLYTENRYAVGGWEEFSNALVPRIVRMAQEGFDCKPLVLFMQNLLQNPSKQSVDELYLFLEQNNLPITEDGCFIAYKIVKNDYYDIYTGKMLNTVGSTVSMPRNQVDDRRQNTCSQGLHFCSKDYLDAYGSHDRNTDRCVLVKINPADVVSIPSDYNNAKGRTWKYEVVGEADSGWRDSLPKRDYTQSAVVNSLGSSYTPVTGDADEVFELYFEDCGDHAVWADTGNLAKFQHMVNKLVQYAYMDEEDAIQYLNERFALNDVYDNPIDGYTFVPGDGWIEDTYGTSVTRFDVMDGCGVTLQQVLDIENA